MQLILNKQKHDMFLNGEKKNYKYFKYLKDNNLYLSIELGNLY